MKVKIICLVIGIVLTVLGFIQFWNYENRSITVEATITEIRDRVQTMDDVYDYRYVYYGEYTVDGEKHEMVRLKSEHSNDPAPKHKVGDKLEIVVDKKDPGHKMAEGGVFGTVGIVMIAWNMIALCNDKKKKKAAE